MQIENQTEPLRRRQIRTEHSQHRTPLTISVTAVTAAARYKETGEVDAQNLLGERQWQPRDEAEDRQLQHFRLL